MMIEKLKYKITTKSKIEKRLPDMKHNSEQKVEDNFRQPVFWQPPFMLCVRPSSRSVILRSVSNEVECVQEA